MSAFRIVARDRMRDRVQFEHEKFVGWPAWHQAHDSDATRPGWDTAPEVDSWMGVGTPEWFDRMNTIASAKAPATSSPGSCDGASTDGAGVEAEGDTSTPDHRPWPAPDPTTRLCAPSYCDCDGCEYLFDPKRPIGNRWREVWP